MPQPRQVALDVLAGLVRADRMPRSVGKTGPASSARTTRMIETPVSRLAGHDGAVHRRGAAVPGQERRVDVDEAQPRQAQHRVGQDLAVRGHDAEIGARPVQRGEERLVLQPLGLQDAAGRARRAHAFTGPSAHSLAAAARPIGLRDDADDRDGARRAARSSVGTANRACRRTRRAAGPAAHHLPVAHLLPDPAGRSDRA